MTLTNVSSASLNVRFYMENPTSEGRGTFLSDSKFQIDRGETATCKLTRHPNYQADQDSVVHINVQPLTPSWKPAGRGYWLEVLSEPPVTIVATGSGKHLEFDVGTGAIAAIPDDQIKKGRFQHEVVSAFEGGADR